MSYLEGVPAPQEWMFAIIVCAPCILSQVAHPSGTKAVHAALVQASTEQGACFHRPSEQSEVIRWNADCQVLKIKLGQL